MVIVFVHTESPRLHYIFSRIFIDILGVEFYFTTNKDEFIASQYPSINYSTQNLEKGIWILPHRLLYDKGICQLDEISVSSWKSMPTIFENRQGDVPFDLFAASFFLLTRYEEYYSTVTDSHGRYPYTESIIHQMGCIEDPIVDQWAYALKEELSIRNPECQFSPRTYQFIPTIDIDHPYLYRNKGFVLNIFSLLKDLLKRNYPIFRERLFTVLFLKEDSYFNFKFLLQLYNECGVKGLFFVHNGPYGTYDRRYIYPSIRYRKMLKNIAKEHSIYIHPSYAAAHHRDLLIKEKKDLEQLIGTNINRSRHHFLRIRIPETYRLLSEIGITHDYSLLYSSTIGFRAGTSIPFPFYDVEKDIETELMIHPSTMMDVTLKRDYKMNAQDALSKIKEMALKIKAVNGDFITIFHNSTLSESTEWKGWQEMYNQMIKQL